ncbi:MAG: hypothetical protein ACI9AX_002574, partial [Polaromonas sp.]
NLEGPIALGGGCSVQLSHEAAHPFMGKMPGLCKFGAAPHNVGQPLVISAIVLADKPEPP